MKRGIDFLFIYNLILAWIYR